MMIKYYPSFTITFMTPLFWRLDTTQSYNFIFDTAVMIKYQSVSRLHYWHRCYDD